MILFCGIINDFGIRRNGKSNGYLGGLTEAMGGNGQCPQNIIADIFIDDRQLLSRVKQLYELLGFDAFSDEQGNVEWSETLLVVDHGIFPITVRDEYGINRGGVPCIIAGSKCDAHTSVFGGYGCDYAVVQGEFVGVITENSIARKFLQSIHHLYIAF